MNPYLHGMNLNLTNKYALVCGASKGIGKAAAIELAELGANVTLLARTRETLEEVLETLPTSGNQSHALVSVDVTNHEELEKKIKHLISKHPVHILVNNSGGPPPGPASTADPAQYLSAFRQHVVANQVITRLVTPGMAEAGYGRIINVISTSVKQPLDGLGVSNTIRGAVGNWAKTLANELGGKGITVNNVLPGATATERLAQIVLRKAEKTGSSIAEIEEKMKSSIPAGRFGLPEEIGAAVAFLASPAAAYINGTNLVVDGGRTKSL